MSEEAMMAVLDHLQARRRRDARAVAAGLHPTVVHQGLSPDARCAGRDEVVDRVTRGFALDRFGVTRVEILDAGDDAAVLGVAGPRFVEQAETPLHGELYIRFTVRDGVIVRMDDFLTREEALAPATAAASGPEALRVQCASCGCWVQRGIVVARCDDVECCCAGLPQAG